jgi:hypothetical protein
MPGRCGRLLQASGRPIPGLHNFLDRDSLLPNGSVDLVQRRMVKKRPIPAHGLCRRNAGPYKCGQHLCGLLYLSEYSEVGR